MKKLSILQINSKKIITNEELVNLRGGYGGSGTCGFSVWIPTYEGGSTMFNWVMCNVSMHEAKQAVADAGNGSWCCDHCYQTTYCG
jgi:hypothetical protein